MILFRLKRKFYNEKEASEEEKLDQLYEDFKKKDFKRSLNKKLSSAGIGAVIGAPVGFGVSKALKKSGIIGGGIGALSGSAAVYKIQSNKQNKLYRQNKDELRSILSGFKTKEEKDKFLEVLKDELNTSTT